MSTRLCNKCGIVKDLEEDFQKAARYRGGYYAQCRECRNNHPSQLPEAKLEKSRRLRKRNRQFIWDYYKTHPCVDCGEEDPLVLELDHCRGEAKIDNLSKLVHNSRSLKVIANEIAKCDSVCANCHKRRTAVTQGWYVDVA